MNASASEPGPSIGSVDAFVGMPAPSAAGVASLDSNPLQQTKSEIRGLASEIAQLAHSQLEPAEFYDGFLPRLCVAMGAKAAGVWHYAADSPLHLVAGHAFPKALLSESKDAQPSEPHLRILRAVAAEGQPILVPPSSVTIECERPRNPLAESLIIVPVRVQDDVEYLLEVIQRPSGGPAAQRGYLRFVAQMADLMSDYLRRQQLRHHTQQQHRLVRVEQWLTAIAASRHVASRQQLAADALADMLEADRVLLLREQRSLLRGTSRVLALSGSKSFDPRSSIVLAAQALHCRLAREQQTQCLADPLWLYATDRRDETLREPSVDTPRERPEQVAAVAIQLEVDELCAALGCRRLLCLGLDGSSDSLVITTHSGDQSPTPEQLADTHASDRRFVSAVIGLLDGATTAGGPIAWLQQIVFRKISLKRGSRGRVQAIQNWSLRAAVAGLSVAIALFPVSQQISATASLEPLSKQMYYAPAAGVVTEVFADEGDDVKAGQALLRITSHELQSRAEDLQIELKKTRDQQAEKSSRLNRGDDMNNFDRDQLVYDLQELDTNASALERQIAATEQRLAELTITARQAGAVSTWDLKNRLLNQPVQPGQLLASTFDPNDQWRLQLSIPDFRAGIVAQAMTQAENGALLVNFSLSSHPAQILQAYAVSMAPQVTVQHGSANANPTRVVRTAALIRDAARLPLKKDGAIARAVVDCGHVAFGWLVVRDAFWAISSRVKMMF